MRVLFINWSQAEYAGGERHLLALMKELRTMGVSPLLLCPRGSPLAGRTREAGIAVEETDLKVFEKTRPGPYLKSVWTIYKTIKGFRPEVVHAQGAYSLYWLMPCSWFPGIPVCCLLQDFEVADRFSLWTLRRIPASFADSDAVRRHMISHYGLNPEKCQTVRQAIEPMPRTDPGRLKALRKRMGLKSGQVAIGICGRIHPNKGHRLFIQAAGLLKHKRELVWYIAGDRDTAARGYLEELDSLIERLGLGSRVRFTGFISDMPEFLATLDIVAVPSLQEPLGLISVEAQAMRRPVIVSGQGGLPETVLPGMSGIVMEQTTSQCLARHVMALAADGRKRREMGRAGQEFYQKHYTIAENARLIFDQYRKISDR